LRSQSAFQGIDSSGTSTPVYLGAYKEAHFMGNIIAKTIRAPMVSFSPNQ